MGTVLTQCSVCVQYKHTPHTHTHTHTHPHTLHHTLTPPPPHPHPHTPHTGTFQLYDHNHDGVITRDEMEAVVEAIYKMVGSMVEFPEGAETPQLRVNRIFEAMDTVHIITVCDITYVPRRL